MHILFCESNEHVKCNDIQRELANISLKHEYLIRTWHWRWFISCQCFKWIH